MSRVGEGSRFRLTGFVRDVTERRALEEQLRQSQKLEAVGRLASGVAHDFNNLLMSIMGSADLMLMQLARDEPARGEAAEIKVSVQRGAGLTRQLLAFSRRQATSPRLIAVEDVIGGMEIMLRRLIGTEVDLDIVRRTATDADRGRSGADRTGDPESGDQRARRDARGRPSDASSVDRSTRRWTSTRPTSNDGAIATRG